MVRLPELGIICNMKDTDFYRQILGIAAPWKAAEVHREMESNRVIVRVELEAGTKWGNPETKAVAHLHKWTERQWRHLDTCRV